MGDKDSINLAVKEEIHRKKAVTMLENVKLNFGYVINLLEQFPTVALYFERDALLQAFDNTIIQLESARDMLIMYRQIIKDLYDTHKDEIEKLRQKFGIEPYGKVDFCNMFEGGDDA